MDFAIGTANLAGIFTLGRIALSLGFGLLEAGDVNLNNLDGVGKFR